MPIRRGQRTKRKDDDPAVKLALIMSRTKRNENGCLVYTGTIKSTGYPQMYYLRKEHRGNRLVFKLVHGSIPKGAMICHHCDNRACVNPEHLYAGTALDNQMDVLKRGRHATAHSEFCVSGRHKFVPANTLKRGHGRWRACRACNNEKTRRRNASRKAAKKD